MVSFQIRRRLLTVALRYELGDADVGQWVVGVVMEAGVLGISTLQSRKFGVKFREAWAKSRPRGTLSMYLGTWKVRTLVGFLWWGKGQTHCGILSVPSIRYADELQLSGDGGVQESYTFPFASSTHNSKDGSIRAIAKRSALEGGTR